MRVISKKRLNEAIAIDKTLAVPLNTWYKVASTAKWTSLVDVRKTYPHADFADPYTVFNIKGNEYRLITKIEYRFALVFIKGVYTHAEYSKEDWKK
jgi:mRNA interferase HigB